MATTTECSFQDDGLWRKLLTRAQKGTTTQGFFVIDVVEGCLHTSVFCKLCLPAAFMHNHFKSLNERIILEGPDGYQWTTMLALPWDSQPCLILGWKEFATAYNLEIQDQVVFLLFENSHFLVQVYDVNNKVKDRRIFASPVQVDMKAMNVSQEETRAPHSDFRSTHGVNAGGKENVIILDSSDEEKEKEKEKEDDQVRVKETPIDASTIGGTFSKMTLRSAKKLEEVGTHDHSMKEKLEKADHSMKDVSPQSVKRLEKSDLLMKYVSPLSVKELEKSDLLMKYLSPLTFKQLERSGLLMKYVSPRSFKKLEKRGHPMKNVSPQSAQKLEKSDHWVKDVSKEQKRERVQLGGYEETVDKELGKSKRSDSAQNSAPSSPELIPLMKRSKKQRRKSGDYGGDDLGRAASFLRSGRLFKLGQAVEKLPPRLYEDAKEPAVVVTKAAFQRVPGSEILTSCCSTQQSTMKNQPRHLLQESTSKITQPPVTVPESHANNSQSVPELAGPETPGGVPAVKPRPKVKVDGEKMRTEELCLPEDEANKRPISRVGASGKPLKLLYVTRRRPVTTQERQDTLAAARTFANQSTGKHCIIQLTTSQVYCGYHLKVPQPEFVEAMQLPFARLTVMLSDERGKLWEVEWLGDHPKWPGLHSAGWTKFVLQHYLEEGDVCVFQKCKVADNTISVEIFPVVPLVAPPEHGWRSHYIVPEIARTVANSELPDQS